MKINFYNMCEMFFNLSINSFNFPKDTIFECVNQNGVTVYNLNSISTKIDDGMKYININLDNSYYPDVMFDNEENIRYFKKSKIETDAKDMLRFVFQEKIFE